MNSFSDEADINSEIKPTESLQFEFETVRLATDNFSYANKLGQGGFGTVYKVTFLLLDTCYHLVKIRYT